MLQDPLADGPVIQAAATRALLDQHVTLNQVRHIMQCPVIMLVAILTEAGQLADRRQCVWCSVSVVKDADVYVLQAPYQCD